MKLNNLITLFSCSLILYFSYSSTGYGTEVIGEENPQNLQNKESKISDSTLHILRKEPKKDETSASQSDETSAFQSNVKGSFTIQIGAFLSESNAIQSYNTAKSQLNAEVYYKPINGLFKVMVGEYATAADALIELTNIRKAGFFGAYIILKL